MSYGLTRRQKELLEFIRGHIAAQGFSPSYREMQLHAGLNSLSGVSRLVNALAERGHIAFLRNAKRSITLADARPRVLIHINAAGRYLGTTYTEAEVEVSVAMEAGDGGPPVNSGAA